jgi:hypothetical protein
MAVNGLAVAKFLSRAGDVVGHVLGACAGVHYFRRAPDFRQQRTNDPRVWADEFEIGGNRDRARRGQQFLLLCGSSGGTERDSTRRRAGPGAGFHVRFNQSVIELGAVLWVLMGWTFVAAEFIGAFILITLVWLLIRLFLPKNIESKIRVRLAMRAAKRVCHPTHSTHLSHAHSESSPAEGEHEAKKWTRVAHAFVTDWSMLWKEILGGFLIAGFLATLVPHDWWETLFLQTGPAVVRLIAKRAGGPDHRRNLIRLFRREYSTSEFALGPWHQFWRRNFVYLRRPARHPDPRDLREILWCARRGLDHRYFLRGDGSRRNHCRSHVHRIGTNSAGIASAQRN